jgi:N-acetylmuramoyl-L-alanine amidase CwlA
VRLVAYLMGRFSLSTDDVIRHYDVTGKNCPKYFVENPDAWKEFKKDVNQFILDNGE